MKIITLNINGIRAAEKKGFFAWLSRQQADVICLQETKAQIDQLTPAMINPNGYQGIFNSAEKKGYSGVAMYTRQTPDRIIDKLGWTSADTEGRYLQLDFGQISIASLYLPSGSSSEERQTVKFEFMDNFLPVLKKMRRQKRKYILCGDWNIAHREIDLKNWRGNRKNSGFLPEERAWLDVLFDDVGFVDAFRAVDESPEQYTWWSNRGQAWLNNVGWRIDYQIVSPSLQEKIQGAKIYKAKRFSDHAPLIIDYDINL